MKIPINCINPECDNTIWDMLIEEGTKIITCDRCKTTFAYNVTMMPTITRYRLLEVAVGAGGNEWT